ncbi:hypothetical protein PR202_gb21952 [Eleusine coracana subsp. coracana]|uniref:Uncharacterized protein n=1 Tax=Eleusine coracana subsp. coracana TaxID=191504 RepID=A0AAV5FCC5_ELECO|nr:hypothetical protein PR202_gb21952 [Eleusine coracana subsp. coracana]
MTLLVNAVARLGRPVRIRQVSRKCLHEADRAGALLPAVDSYGALLFLAVIDRGSVLLMAIDGYLPLYVVFLHPVIV